MSLRLSGSERPRDATSSGPRPAGVDDHVGLPVVRHARVVESLTPSNVRPASIGRLPGAAWPDRTARGSRPPARPRCPSPAARPSARAAGQPAARRDDVPGLSRSRSHRLGLEPAEGASPRRGEDVGDRAALARHDHVIGLDEAPPEAAGEEPPHRDLPAPMKPTRITLSAGSRHPIIRRGPRRSP